MFCKKTLELYEQELHVGCTDSTKEAYFTVETVNNGVGDYLVLNTQELAFSEHDEIEAFASILHTFLPG